MSGPVTVTRSGRVAHLRLSDPARQNLMGAEMLRALARALGGLRFDSELRVVVLSGAGACFSCGGDRREWQRLAAVDATGGAVRSFAALGREVCDALAALDAVTIAQVHGTVYGAALALMLACDLRFGAEHTAFALPEPALGVPPAWDGMVARLVDELGRARARELLLLGEPFDAEQAASMALLTRLVAPGELAPYVDRWARTLTHRPTEAVRSARRLLRAERLGGGDVRAAEASFVAALWGGEAVNQADGVLTAANTASPYPREYYGATRL